MEDLLSGFGKFHLCVQEVRENPLGGTLDKYLVIVDGLVKVQEVRVTGGVHKVFVMHLLDGLATLFLRSVIRCD